MSQGHNAYGNGGIPALLGGLLLGAGAVLVGLAMTRNGRRPAPVPTDLAPGTDALKALFRSAPLGIAILDPEGRVTAWSEAAEAMFGWTAEEVIGRPLPTVPDDHQEEHEQVRAAVFAGATRRGVEVVRRRRDGSHITMSLSVAPLRGASGDIRGAIAIMEDVSARRRAEWLRERSERELRAVLDVLPVGLVIGDREGRTVASNRSMRELWGGDPDFAAVSAWWAETGAPVAPDEWGHVRALRRERCESEEILVETLDGLRRTILAYAVPIVGDGEEVSGSVTVHVDITARRMREEVERFVAEATRSFGVALDEDAVLARIGEALVPRLADAVTMFQERDGELERRTVSGPLPTDGASRVAVAADHPVRRVMRERRPLLLEEVDDAVLSELTTEASGLEVLRRLKIRSLLMVPIVVRGEARGAMVLAALGARALGDQELAVAVQVADRAAVALDNARLFREVERRAREEEALREATAAVSASFTTEEVVQRIAESAIRAVDADGAIVERLRLAGDELEVVAVAGQTPDLRTRVSLPGSLAERVLELQDAVRLVDAHSSERDLLRHVRLWCPGGSVIAVPLLDAGEPLGALLILRHADRRPFDDEDLQRARVFADLASLTFRKIHLLEESEGRREELEIVDASRAQLVRGFSHDVRNPLNAAMLHLQLLERGRWGALPAEQHEVLETVTRSIREAVGLMDDLVDLARAQASQVSVDCRPTNVDRAAEEMVGEYRAAAEEKGLSLTMSGPAGLTMIESDPSRVRQVLGNLVSNAVKYTESGAVTVSVDKTSSGPRPGRWVAVTVADTGPGIPAEKQALLFEEFTRLSADGEGHGLGLAIAKRIAEALGGTITLESAVGRGSTFTFWLPMGPQREPAGIA